MGTHVHPWWIHVNVWQNQHSIVKKLKKNRTEKKKPCTLKLQNIAERHEKVHNYMERCMGREEGGGSCLGTHVHPWWIHVNVWQNQYSIVK